MKGLRAMCLVISVTFVIGCAGLSGKKAAPTQVGAKKKEMIQRLANNIPLYPKFKYVPEKSFFFESGGLKAGVMVFEGKAKVGEVVKFYKREMPNHGWDMKSAYEYGKEALLDFEAPDKTCQVSIHEETFKTILIIRTGSRPIS